MLNLNQDLVSSPFFPLPSFVVGYWFTRTLGSGTNRPRAEEGRRTKVNEEGLPSPVPLKRFIAQNNEGLENEDLMKGR